MTLGEKLSKLRRENNYTQEQLAQILGVSRQSISKWESDIAYPETEKLVKIGKLFDCSMDYLLNEDITEKHGRESAEKVSVWKTIKAQLRERKSEKTLFGMPLYHIGKNARGFFAIGLKARGVFSIGLLSTGVFSLGMLSIGLISIGILSLGLVSIGSFALGILSIGAIAFGLFALGAIGIGIVSFGALSVGCFSGGALAVGKYIALGDHSYAMIAIGKTVAEGRLHSYIGDIYSADLSEIGAILNQKVPSWLCWAKDLFLMLIK